MDTFLRPVGCIWFPVKWQGTYDHIKISLILWVRGNSEIMIIGVILFAFSYPDNYLQGHYFAYACDSSEQWAYGSHGSACSQFGHIHPFHCWERPELRGDQTGVDAHFTCVPLVSTVRS